MEKHVVGSKILKKEQVLIGIFLIAILLLSSGSMVAFASNSNSGRTIAVWPNGHDDTSDIQAAFYKCGTSPGCTVQLVKGTYYVGQIAVYGFQGSFIGMGQGATIIQALPNLPSPAPEYNTPETPFWAGLPGPSNPWPVLFTFVGGSFSISGMTLTDPYTTPTQGWYWPGDPTPYTSLYSAIEITGLQRASATIDHVTVLGALGDAMGPNTFNLWEGICYEGTSLPTGWTNAFTQIIPISGTLSMTNSVFNSVESGPFVDTLIGATVTVCYNTITYSFWSTGFFDSYNSKLTFCGNQITDVTDAGAGIAGYEDFFEPGTLPSTVYITNNQINQVSQGSNAIILYDGNTVPVLSAVVSGNVLQTDTSCGCYVSTDPAVYSAFMSFNLKSLVVSQNIITNSPAGGSAGVYITGGPATVSGNTITSNYYGVYLDAANNVQVTGNVIRNSVQYGIALTDGSSYNHVIGNLVMHSGAYDLYWDGTGTGNVWYANQCQTSSPSGLCSGEP